MRVQVMRLPHAADLPLPEPQTAGAAGLDLAAAVTEPLTLAPGEWKLVPTGLAVALPDGYELQVRPRSGLAAKHGITVLNSPGTVDADYRGEIKVILINFGSTPFTVRRGDRIAQALLSQVTRIVWDERLELPDTDRGSGGFGHTGSGSKDLGLSG